MATFKVRALYDFTGEPNTAEMSISAGEILTVTRQEVGDGWWEGTKTNGKTGLFPASYVEMIVNNGPPDRPPPVLQQNYDDWDDTNQNNEGNDIEGWDDDWDDDTYSEIGPGQNQQMYGNENFQQVQQTAISNQEIDSSGAIDNRTMSKRKFSAFVKSGGEGYIYGNVQVTVPESEKIYISYDNDMYQWPIVNSPYTVVVASPKKESKLKGFKSYIVYQLTPSFSNIKVSRRYKHFDWLHERLTEKFGLIPIPPLPDKQVTGRYEEQFIENRRLQLQEFVDWLCRHPVLSKCQVWQHFITCTDEKLWKVGKRNAEKDQLIGANCCIIFEAPEKQLLPSFVDAKMDKFGNFIHSMDLSVKNLLALAYDQQKKMQGPYKREYQKIGESFYALGGSLELDEENVIPTTKLTDALKRTGAVYIDIGKLFEEQSKYDWDPMSHKLYLYKGLTNGFHDILGVQRNAIQKRKECERLTSEQKMDIKKLTEVTRRVDVISYTVLAEMNHFKSERNVDMNVLMKHFLQQQIAFYQNVVHKLQGALELFD